MCWPENIGRLIAENEALSTKEAVALFCVKMNEEAALLGAEQSHFANPDGYHHEDHYTTAYDLLLISLEALQHPTIREICAMTASTRTLVSGQKLPGTTTISCCSKRAFTIIRGSPV